MQGWLWMQTCQRLKASMTCICRAAALRFKGHYPGLPAAYSHLCGTWLPTSGFEAGDSPIFEDHLQSPMDTAPENLLTDICLPLALSVWPKYPQG